MADSRIHALTVNGTKDFGASVATDKSGDAEARQMTLGTLLRTMKSDTTDYTSGFDDTGSVDYTDHELHFVEIDPASGTFTLTISNVPDNSVNWLFVTKQSSNLMKFSGVSANGSVYGRNVGLIEILYKVISIDSRVYLIQQNTQFSDTYLLANYSSTQGTINSVTYAEYTVNDNKLHFETQFSWSALGGSTSIVVLIDGFNISLKNNIVSANIFSAGINPSANFYNDSATVGAIGIRFNETLTSTHTFFVTAEAIIE